MPRFDTGSRQPFHPYSWIMYQITRSLKSVDHYLSDQFCVASCTNKLAIIPFPPTTLQNNCWIHYQMGSCSQMDYAEVWQTLFAQRELSNVCLAYITTITTRAETCPVNFANILTMSMTLHHARHLCAPPTGIQAFFDTFAFESMKLLVWYPWVPDSNEIHLWAYEMLYIASNLQLMAFDDSHW